MGTLMDLNKRSTHDYVDNPYWSIIKIRVRYLLHQIYVSKNKDQLQSNKWLTDEELAWRQKSGDKYL